MESWIKNGGKKSMIRKCLVSVLSFLLLLGTLGFAQDEGIQSIVDYKVNKMKRELNLTDTQSEAIRPVIKDYWVRRQAILQDVAVQGIVDHVAVKGTLKTLKEDEYQKLGRILSADQMKKWINKQNLMATLNPDSMESSVDDEVGLTGSGVNLKF
jgi:hypothetical protein